jgi:hypothetical protein
MGNLNGFSSQNFRYFSDLSKSKRLVEIKNYADVYGVFVFINNGFN